MDKLKEIKTDYDFDFWKLLGLQFFFSRFIFEAVKFDS